MKYIKVMLSANLGNFYSLAIAGLFLDYLPMLPVQILLCDLLSNLPLLTFAADRVSKKEVRRPNISINQVIIIAALLGLVTTVFDFIYLSRFSHAAPATVQTGWFIWSILSELIVIFSVRTNRFFLRGTPPGMLLVLVVVCIGALSIALPYICIDGWCPGQLFFALVPIPLSFLSGIGFLLAVYFSATEIVKLLYIHIWSGYASVKRVKKGRA
jgi:Mg2+-importing ATPase